MRFSRLYLAVSFCALAACGEKEKPSEEAESTGMLRPVEPCAQGGALSGQCGTECARNSDCPSGQFCSDDTCTAECTPHSGCLDTCSADGHCEGQREMVVILPQQQQDDGNFIEDPSDLPSGEFASCATGQARGELTPVSLFVMFDNSLSMAENDKWPQATEAMSAFFKDPESSGLQIALRFFGNSPVAGCDGEACTNNTLDACAEPQVPLAGLTREGAPTDAQEAILLDTLDAANADFGGTPMYAALRGAVAWATQHRTENPNTATAVVFVTDGVPQYQDCTEDIGEIAALAGSGFDQGVRTYAIGLQGSQQSQMDRIAEAGGTSAGIFIGSGDASAELLEALRAIRGQVASCDVQLPPGNDGADLDPSKVNVTLSVGGESLTLGQVPNDAGCADDGAWYYDDPTNPSRILLCPASCDAVLNDPASRIDIVLGCVTSDVPAQIAR